MEPIKVVYFSSSDRALPVLKSILNDKRFAVIGVVTQPDRPVGRSRTLSPTPVKLFAIDQDIPVFTPDKLAGNESFVQELERLSADLIVVAYYALLIPKEALESTKYGGINIHPSLLPQYRGPSPVQWVIYNGEKMTGVSFIQMNEKFDEGKLLKQIKIAITPDETGESLYLKSFIKAAEVVAETAWGYVTGILKPFDQPQTDNLFYARRMSKEDGRIDWSRSDLEIERQIRAFYPWPGAWTTLLEVRNWKLEARSSSNVALSSSDKSCCHPERTKRGEGSKITSVLITCPTDPTQNKPVGDEKEGVITNPNNSQNEKFVKILKAHLENKDRLVIDTLQVEGKKPISWDEFARGYIP